VGGWVGGGAVSVLVCVVCVSVEGRVHEWVGRMAYDSLSFIV
jgi:hypothetical protein